MHEAALQTYSDAVEMQAAAATHSMHETETATGYTPDPEHRGHRNVYRGRHAAMHETDHRSSRSPPMVALASLLSAAAIVAMDDQRW